MTRNLTLIAAAAAFAITGMSLTATDAEAKRRGGSNYKQWEYDTRHATKGYEGFAGGISGSYCSYRREPERRCFYTRSGYEKCKIVSWRLIQKCY
ncbi:MAG: hypothetical protein ACR2PI_27875 [Hyphomicrobiaceae bacterium]